MPSLNHRTAIAALALGLPVACLVAPAGFSSAAPLNPAHEAAAPAASGNLDLGERPVGDALLLLSGRKP